MQSLYSVLLALPLHGLSYYTTQTSLAYHSARDEFTPRWKRLGLWDPFRPPRY